MDNKIIDKLLCEKMNFTPEQIDTITFICKEVYKDMELNKETQNEYSNFARGLATAEPIKENNKKLDTIPYSSVTKTNAIDPTLDFCRKVSLMRNILVIMDYLNIIFKNGSCIKTDTKTLAIYKNNVDKLISENTDVSIDLDYMLKKWEIQLSNVIENDKSTVGFYSHRCKIRLSLNNELSISRFFDYRKPTDLRLIFTLLLYMKLRFKNKGWDLNDVSFKEISDKLKLSSMVVGEVSVPCVVFQFVYNKNKQESKSTVKSKGGKK